ncbi:MAG: phosphate signaling complex protein PhoU [Cyanobacteria bacterium]|nr:phosphate signaling complex protein PhoU [Cyanobacteriota bacterium]
MALLSELVNNPEPIRVNFDRQLKRVQRDVLRMGALVETSCQLARQAMFERDLEAADQIIVADREIDALYRQIELDCVNMIALQSPVARDLRLLSALMQLVRDIERIGDYAKNLGEVSVRLFPYEVQPQMSQIRTMFDRCRAMLATGLKVLSDLDGKSAEDMQLLDDAVDSDYENLYTLLTQKTELQGSIEPIVLMVLAIRHIERMADHSTNIGKRVSYIVTGER